jgi:hypothetical protein
MSELGPWRKVVIETPVGLFVGEEAAYENSEMRGTTMRGRLVGNTPRVRGDREATVAAVAAAFVAHGFDIDEAAELADVLVD